jgi:O-antigen ligase
MIFQRLFASIALVFLPLTAWSKDAAVVALAGGAIAMSLSPGVFAAVRQSLSPRQPGVLFGLLFCAWMGVSMAWTPAPAATALLKAYAVFGLALILGVGMAHLSSAQRSAITKPLAISFGALLVILVVERLTGGFFIALDRDTETPEQLLNAMNGGLVLMACLTSCAALLIYRFSRRLEATFFFFVFVVALALTYRMDAVPVALIAGAVCSAAVVKWGRAAAVGCLMVIGAGVLSWPVVAWIAAASDLHIWTAEYLHPNWGHRIAIWGAVGEFIADKAMFGYGFNSARVIGQTAELMPDPQGRTSFLHPHNGLLQVWLELGLVGVVLLYATLASAARSILAQAHSAFALGMHVGAFVAALTIWLLSFGVWQGWWMSALALAIAAGVFVSVSEPASPGSADS